MNSGWSARVLARRPGGCSSRSARMRASRAAAGACGLVQDSRRWKNGQRRNMPPGPGSAEIVACPIPCPPQRIRRLQAAGSASRSRPPGSRRVGTARPPSAPPSVRRSQPACLRLEHAVHHPRMGDQERLDPRTGKDQAAQRPGGDDVGDRGLAEEDRDLSEELAAGEACPFLAVDDDATSPSRMTWKPEPLRPWRRASGPPRRPTSSNVWTTPSSCGDGQVGEQRRSRRSRR